MPPSTELPKSKIMTPAQVAVRVGTRARVELCVVALALAFCGGCDDRQLRGAVSESPDGRTYFGIVDDNGGKCGLPKVDGVVWPHPIGEVVPFEAGSHTISCGTEVEFVVPAGMVFKFDNWGP